MSAKNTKFWGCSPDAAAPACSSQPNRGTGSNKNTKFWGCCPDAAAACSSQPNTANLLNCESPLPRLWRLTSHTVTVWSCDLELKPVQLLQPRAWSQATGIVRQHQSEPIRLCQWQLYIPSRLWIYCLTLSQVVLVQGASAVIWSPIWSIIWFR